MAKKKTTKAGAPASTRKKSAASAKRGAEAVETHDEHVAPTAPRAARTAEKQSMSDSPAASAPGPNDRTPRGRSRRGGAKSGSRASGAESAPAKADGVAKIEREDNAVVIRFAPVKVAAPPAVPAAPPPPMRPREPAVSRSQARQMPTRLPPAPVAPPPPVAPPSPAAPVPASRPRATEPPAGYAFDERVDEDFDDSHPRDEVAPPGNRIAEPAPEPPNLRARDVDERGGDGRRRRRRRGRGGRGRGAEGRADADRGNRAPDGPIAPPTHTDRENPPRRPAGPPARGLPPAVRADGEADKARPGVEAGDGPRPMSRSQKRRMRRRRRFDQPASDANGITAPEGPVVNDGLFGEPTVVNPLPVDIGGSDEDEHEMDDRLEARELLESGEAEAESGGAATAGEAERAEGAAEPGRRRDRRGGRGGRSGAGRRRWRDAGESADADSRVYGEDEGESSMVEIEPEAQPIGLDAMESLADPGAPRPTGKKREMIVNIVPHEECRIAILEDGKLEQIYLERASAENHVGNIYKGIVTNVEASIQAAFIDFGLGKNGFLHISDLHPKFFPGGGADERTEDVGRKMPRKARPPIQRCLRRGQELIVQITKEGIGTKGPTLTSYLSVPGRFLVMMPGMRQLGVSRKIEDDDLRRKLRSQLNELELPDDIGFIARTAAEDRSRKELQADLNYLTRLWRAVEKRITTERAPAELYRDSDLVIRTIRDVFSTDIEKIIVDDASVADRAADFLSIFSPRANDIVMRYSDPQPIFHRYGIEVELERLHSRHVPLRSGGSLVIDQTEALVAIDVNSGKFRTEDDAETTAYKINMEAADEIPRQLRLRDLGGVIICDFIDLRFDQHRREIERRLIANLKQHKERAKVLRMSQFGIIEMTRQRQRASLTRSVYQDCHHCRGSGLVKTSESVALDVMRLVQLAVTREHIRQIEVTVSPEVAYLIQNRKRAVLHEIESQYERSISVRPDTAYSLDQVQIHCYDHRGRLAPHG